jgi:GDSL/SGNH-like Acyl-Esterase family found in Pmr5 and Cas1p
MAKRIFWLPGLLLVAVLQLFKTPLPQPPPPQPQPQPLFPPAQELPPSVDQERSLCSNHQVADGRWIPITLERPPYIPLSPRVRCLRTEDFYKPFPTYRWKPDSSCRFTDWNAPQFTQLLSNQTIVFVGDSLSLEHYASLVHLLGDRARLPPKAVQYNRIARTICHNTTTTTASSTQQQHCVRLVFQTDFPLVNLSHTIRQNAPSVLILNRGAHYVPDEQLLADLRHSTFPALQEWNQPCTNCLLVWRTTVPGHPYCHRFTKPATSVAEMEDWIWHQSTNDSTVYRKGEFHWHDFQRQNQLVAGVLETEWKPQLHHVEIQIMDSYRPNILRPDAHRAHMNDCLHSCSPGGGSDLNSQWLLHMVHLWQQPTSTTLRGMNPS